MIKKVDVLFVCDDGRLLELEVASVRAGGRIARTLQRAACKYTMHTIIHAGC